MSATNVNLAKKSKMSKILAYLKVLHKHIASRAGLVSLANILKIGQISTQCVPTPFANSVIASNP